jgi:hypothetical protein
MGSLACGGRVALKTDVESVAAWGLDVFVRFRAAEDWVLLTDRQSGGERAVATMMLLLAMQEATPLPFRVVDEINQGMDATNERAVVATLAKLFDGLNEAGGAVAAAPGGVGGAAAPAIAHASGRQLFIVTPKLLSNLRHAPSMRSLIVFNGSQVAGQADVARFFLSFCALAEKMPAVGGGAGAGGGGGGGGGAAAGAGVLAGFKRREADGEEDGAAIGGEEDSVAAKRTRAQ